MLSPVQGEFQSKLTLMSESPQNDGRIWVPKKKEDAEAIPCRPNSNQPTSKKKIAITIWSAVTRPMAISCLATLHRVQAKERCDGSGYGVGPTGYAVYLDFSDAIKRLGKSVIGRKIRQSLSDV